MERVIRFSASERDKVEKLAQEIIIQHTSGLDERILLAAITEAARRLTEKNTTIEGV